MIQHVCDMCGTIIDVYEVNHLTMDTYYIKPSKDLEICGKCYNKVEKFIKENTIKRR